MNMYDTSVKVPALFRLPGVIPQGAVSDALLSGYDVFPTLLEFAGVEYGGGADSLPGRSFLPLLRGEAAEAREHVVVYDEYGPVRMVRDKEWKHIHRYPYGPHELYHLSEDAMERRNLVDDSQYDAIRRRMKAQLDEWFLRYADPARDGSREPVTGAGQIGRKEFAPLESSLS